MFNEINICVGYIISTRYSAFYTCEHTQNLPIYMPAWAVVLVLAPMYDVVITICYGPHTRAGIE